MNLLTTVLSGRHAAVLSGRHAAVLSGRHARVHAVGRRHRDPVNDRLSARQAARELEAMLDGRGFGGQLARDDQPARDTSVLSVDGGLTVRCWSGMVSLTTPWGSCQRWHYADLVEAAEQTVRRYEELGRYEKVGLETDLVQAQ